MNRFNSDEKIGIWGVTFNKDLDASGGARGGKAPGLKTKSRALASMLSVAFVLAGGMGLTACGASLGSNDDSTQAQTIRDSKTIENRYDLVTGVYTGVMSNDATGLKNVKATVLIFTIPIVDGRYSDGTPKVRPELHGRFQLDDYPTDTDTLDLLGDYDAAGNLALSPNPAILQASAAAGAATGAVPNTVSLSGKILNNRAQVAVFREGGQWGTFVGALSSKDASAPAEGDIEQQRERFRKLYQSVEGTYTAKIQSPRGNGYGVEISITQSDLLGGNGLVPALAAHYRRLDVMPGEGIGEYEMRVDYDALTGTVVMQSTTPDKEIPGSSQVSVRGQLLQHVLTAEIRDKNGLVGTITAHATNIPNQQQKPAPTPSKRH